MTPNPSVNRPDHGLSLVTISETSMDFHRWVSINARFHLFIERVGISGCSLVIKINENCFIFYRVTKS